MPAMPMPSQCEGRGRFLELLLLNFSAVLRALYPEPADRIDPIATNESRRDPIATNGSSRDSTATKESTSNDSRRDSIDRAMMQLNAASKAVGRS